MGETRRESWAEYFGLAVSTMPAAIATGHFPRWDVLPFAGWFALAAVGYGIAGAIATPRWRRGLISGLVTGAGVFAGVWAYAAIWADFSPDHKVSEFEIPVGVLIGGAPGFILSYAWARARRERADSAPRLADGGGWSE